MRAICFAIALALCIAQLSLAQVDPRWKPNDPDRPVPAVIVPGTASTQDSPGRPPSDSIVLFDGKDLSQWTTDDGQPAKWKVADGGHGGSAAQRPDPYAPALWRLSIACGVRRTGAAGWRGSGAR